MNETLSTLSLSTLIETYKDVLAKEEALKKSKEELKTSIVEEMRKCGFNKYETSLGTTAAIADKTTVKYNDEAKIIKYLKEHNLSKYVVEKVDATAFNKELKNSKSLTESLNTLYTTSMSVTLTVK